MSVNQWPALHPVALSARIMAAISAIKKQETLQHAYQESEGLLGGIVICRLRLILFGVWHTLHLRLRGPHGARLLSHRTGHPAHRAGRRHRARRALAEGRRTPCREI